MDKFLIHSAEQILRFSSVKNWDDLPPHRREQLGFNMGAFSYALNVGKENGWDKFVAAREGALSMAELHNHLRGLIDHYGVPFSEDRVARPV